MWEFVSIFESLYDDWCDFAPGFLMELYPERTREECNEILHRPVELRDSLLLACRLGMTIDFHAGVFIARLRTIDFDKIYEQQVFIDNLKDAMWGRDIQ